MTAKAQGARSGHTAVSTKHGQSAKQNTWKAGQLTGLVKTYLGTDASVQPFLPGSTQWDFQPQIASSPFNMFHLNDTRLPHCNGLCLLLNKRLRKPSQLIQFHANLVGSPQQMLLGIAPSILCLKHYPRKPTSINLESKGILKPWDISLGELIPNALGVCCGLGSKRETDIGICKAQNNSIFNQCRWIHTGVHD